MRIICDDTMSARCSRVLLALLLAAAVVGATGCDFPFYMQSNGTQRDWSGRIKHQFTEFTLQIRIDGNVMHVVSTDSTANSYRCACLQNVGDEKVLVAYEENGQHKSKYTCIHFVRRGSHVIQLKMASIGQRMDRSLCDDSSLVLDSWLIVDRAHILSDSDMCSMQGGFSIRIFDKMSKKGVCDGYQGETRLESECVKGDGLNFYFRHHACIPGDLYMYTTQRTPCLANWREGAYTFMMLRHDHLDYIWVMRYPSVLGESFVAFLFKDLVGDAHDRVESTDNYVRLDSVRDTPRPVTSLCVDDYEVCSYSSNPCDDGQMALTCPRTCGLCNASRPAVCTFKPEWRGRWYESPHMGSPAVTLDENTLAIHGELGTSTYHCIRWDPPSGRSTDQERYTSQEMVVMEFHNGCRPRYSCARFLKRSASVMFVKLSRSATWPFTNTMQEPVDCKGFEYETDENPHTNRFRTHHYRLIYNKNTRNQAVACNLPDDLKNYAMISRDNSECLGNVVQSHSGTSITLNYTNCRSNVLATTYTCLESSDLVPTDDLMIITRTPTRPVELQCWLFPRRPRTTFYLLDAMHCDERAKRRLRKDRIQPIALFNKHRQNPRYPTYKPETSTPKSSRSTKRPHLKEKPTNADVNTGGYYVVHNGNRTPTPNRTSSNTTNSTSQEDETNSSPFVVIAAVIFFAVFQIPCLCKSSS